MEKRYEPKRLGRAFDRRTDQDPESCSTPCDEFISKEIASSLRVKQCALVGSKQLDLFVLMDIPSVAGRDPLNEDSVDDLVLSLQSQLELFGVGRKGFL